MPTDDNFQSCVPDMERIVKDYGTQLLRMCFMYLKDMQHAEDAVQETFIKVYRSY
ncbi:MAG: sigma factor [Oscillospiraceae bacterium]